MASSDERFEAIDEALDRVFGEVEHLVDWAHTHDAEHVNEDKRMNLLLTQLTEHDTNHHGRASTIKQGGLIGTTLVILGVIVEVLRSLVF